MIVLSMVYLYGVLAQYAGNSLSDSVGGNEEQERQAFATLRRVEIAEERDAGRLTPSESNQLLADVEHEVGAVGKRRKHFFRTDVSFARWLMLGAMAIMVLGSVSLYQKLGYAAEVVFTQDLQTQQLTPQKITEFLQYRSERYGRTEDWYYLASDYVSAGKYQEAVTAFEKALEKRPQHAEDRVALLAEYALAIFYANDNQSSPKMQTVVKTILQQDPTQATALDLKGVAEFAQHNYLGAVLAWQEAIRYSVRSAERLALLSAIAKARQLGRIDYQQVAPIITHQLAVKIEWDANARPWRSDDVLLVYALAEGEKMPIAIQRVFPEDLEPLILLTNLDALMPTATLAETKKVDVVVKLSSINDNDLTKGRIIGIKHGLLTNSKEIFAIKVAL
ncbi:tetratricopeptide repeat protein [Marinomonas sp. M1K-6]|uniref:Tetratricopeptide repeat protein n=2 Tax=Marinomonas profundi TaxID=2726122 RepID=A0A847R2M9_9GAMM|nr:tetratricopeptide repeat protein [Marinomonas profundi]UDV04814.1 tetratricopeptide repeat protein [Marinomonas profundi]